MGGRLVECFWEFAAREEDVAGFLDLTVFEGIPFNFSALLWACDRLMADKFSRCGLGVVIVLELPSCD